MLPNHVFYTEHEHFIIFGNPPYPLWFESVICFVTRSPTYENHLVRYWDWGWLLLLLLCWYQYWANLISCRVLVGYLNRSGGVLRSRSLVIAGHTWDLRNAYMTRMGWNYMTGQCSKVSCSISYVALRKYTWCWKLKHHKPRTPVFSSSSLQTRHADSKIRLVIDIYSEEAPSSGLYFHNISTEA